MRDQFADFVGPTGMDRGWWAGDARLKLHIIKVEANNQEGDDNSSLQPIRDGLCGAPGASHLALAAAISASVHGIVAIFKRAQSVSLPSIR
jgi:hypothetical protein